MLRRCAHLFEYLFRRRRLEDELDAELRSALEMTVDRFIARGMPPAQARRAARLEFEGLDQVKESVRDRLAGSGCATLLQDVRYAWRGLGRRPSFTAIALITLALGIGVNTAVFSVFYGVLLHPLPYDRPDQLVRIWATFQSAGNSHAPVSGIVLGELARCSRSLSGVAGIWTITRTFTGDEPEQVKCARVTPNFFDLLGVRAAQGRTFAAEDGGSPGIMLTQGFFRRRFAGNEKLLATQLPMDRDNRLVGVLPAGFQLHFAPDSNIPTEVQVFETFGSDVYYERGQYYIRLIGRLKRGVPLAEAQQDLDRVAREISAAYSEYAADHLRLNISGMQADAVRDVKPAMVALFAGSVLIMLICCVNVAGLLLARAGDRRKEMALRLALGASSGRVLRQLLVEGAMLSVLGGIAGLAAGWAGLRALMAIRPERLARIADVGMNWSVLTYTAAGAFVAAMLFGFVPAFESLRVDFMTTLRTGSRGWLSRFHRRAGRLLIVGEITLGFVLVTGALLTARTLAKVEHVSPGFEPRSVLTFQLDRGIPPAQFPEWEDQLAALPGVESAGAITILPLDTDLPNWYSPYRPEGVPAGHEAAFVSDLRAVTPGYFTTMGVRFIEGRNFTRQDRDGAREVIIVDDLLARTTWPGQSAVGKHIYAEHVTPRNGFEYLLSDVIGVVEHIHNHSLTRELRGQIYFPFDQSPRTPVSFVLRAHVPPLTLVPAVRRMLRERSKTAALAKVRPMTAYVEREIAPVSFTAVLAATFAVLALLLAATGIYGVLNYQVSRRLPEMGIRMAMGARSGDVFQLVLGEGLWLAATGVVLGGAGALAAAQWLGALVYGVSPRDPLSYGAALLLLPAAAFLGCWRPARRAAAANPADMIREE